VKTKCGIGILLLVGAAWAQSPSVDPLAGLDRKAVMCPYNGRPGVPGCVTPPHATYQPDPEYPAKARKKKESGTIVLALVVGSDGLPYEVKVVRGLSEELDRAATDCVARWRFSPASKDGRPVPAEIHAEVSFHLY